MTEREPLSVILTACDEEDRLPRALNSVAWADEVVVVDSGSRDATPDIARRAGARLILHPWEGYSAQKVFAVSQTTHSWILWIDADEEVTPTLRRSIEAALGREARAPHFAAYTFPRRTEYLGRLMRFGGWYPDRKLRLFRKDRATFDAKLVHESVRVAGPVGRLRGDLHHYSHRDLSHHIEKTHALARLWAAERRGERRVGMLDLLLHPLVKGWKSYIWKGGFLEGWRGVLLAGMGSYSVWLKYALLRAMQHEDASRGSATGDRPQGKESVHAG
jgi:glycosyltransferase involved in cell wall biosynthesis